MTHTLALDIDYAHENAGWIKCSLIIDGVSHDLDASCVFPPFLELLRFVKAVAGQRFPARYFWDEEGFGANFDATAVADDDRLVHLKIRHYDHEEDVIWLDADMERETVVQAFLPPIVDMSRSFLLAEKEWFLPGRVVEHIRQAIEQGIPLRSDTHSPQYAEFRVRGEYKTEYVEGQVFLDIWLEDDNRRFLLSHDTSPFWKDLIPFFERIADGNLPAECTHERRLTFADETYHSWTTFRAENTDVPQNFRLKIITKEDEEEPFLSLDEVVDRARFVQGFVNSFSDFLQNDYQVKPDRDGKTFDLRTLLPGKLFQS